MLSSPVVIGFLVASIVMGAIHRRISLSGSLLAVLYCLPFTVMHESAHFFVAYLTGGRPSSFNVWPKRVAGGWLLGSVTAVPTLLSAAPTALAPLGWLVIGYNVMHFWEYRPVWLPDYMFGVILYSCAAACTPSWQDIKIAIKHPISLLMWMAAAYVIIRFSPTENIQLFISQFLRCFVK